MKILLKVTAVILLLAITLLSIDAAEGGVSKVVIEGVGQPTVKSGSNGSITWFCDPTTSNKCTITIEFNQ